MANKPNIFQRVIKAVRNQAYAYPTFADPPDFNPRKNAVNHNLQYYIAPVQLERLKADVKMWREAMNEIENVWTPHRVKTQQLLNDTILSGHTLACVNRRKDLTLLRDWDFVNEADKENKELKKLFNKRWFATFLEWTLEARLFGYTLIALNDIVNDGFPKMKLIKRFNVSPDRLNVTQYIYSLSGAQFLEQPYVDWHVWIPTNTDVGTSDVGYGILYNVAIYEILARNLQANNADAIELYGMPVRKGTTNKTEEHERAEFMNAMTNMGSTGAILLDAFSGDTLDLIESKGMGQGYKIYGDFEKRLEAKTTKIILGHADAMDSIPGKLGATQGEESPAGMAMRDKQASDGAFIEDIVNDIFIPKLINLGFTIDTKYKFKFSNNQELVEARKKEDANNLVTAQIAQTMASAKLQYDPAEFEKRTGIKTTLIAMPTPVKQELPEDKINRIANLYKHKH